MGERRPLSLRHADFDGPLLRDAASRRRVSTDFGRVFTGMPSAVLQAASAGDIATAVIAARAAGLAVAARGRGHSTNGGSLARGGLVISTAALSRVGRPHRGAITAGGGATWQQLLARTLPAGLTPPIVPDYLDLTIGGVLSMGGLGYQSSRFGAVADHVLALTVVTGTGDIVACSPRKHADLFEAALGGLGHFGVIVEATLRLAPAPPHVISRRYVYRDHAVLLEDMRRLARAPGADTVCAFDIPNHTAVVADVLGAAAGGLWIAPWTTPRLWILQVGTYDWGTRKRPADPGLRLRALPFVCHRSRESYRAFITRNARRVEVWKQSGLWEVPHPWLTVVLPAREAKGWLDGALAGTDPADLTKGPMMMYPLPTVPGRASFLQMPARPPLFRIDIFCSVPRGRGRSTRAMLARNGRLYADCVARGGVQYPSGALALDPERWRRHYARVWQRFAAARRRYDPDGIFVPGLTGRSRPLHEE